jgi:hypothetical protein
VKRTAGKSAKFTGLKLGPNAEIQKKKNPQHQFLAASRWSAPR